VNLHWHVDLVSVGIEQNRQDIYGSNSFDQVYPRTDYMNRIKNQANYPDCVRGQPDTLTPASNYNYWCGLKVNNFNAKMDATYGLLIFAAILSFITRAVESARWVPFCSRISFASSAASRPSRRAAYSTSAAR
jgi:hypothetical protein